MKEDARVTHVIDAEELESHLSSLSEESKAYLREWIVKRLSMVYDIGYEEGYAAGKVIVRFCN